MAPRRVAPGLGLPAMGKDLAGGAVGANLNHMGSHDLGLMGPGLAIVMRGSMRMKTPANIYIYVYIYIYIRMQI